MWVGLSTIRAHQLLQLLGLAATTELRMSNAQQLRAHPCARVWTDRNAP
jgi:hypothetical protein